MYENPAVPAIDSELPHGEMPAEIVVYTVLHGVIVHGLIAKPFARRIGREVEG